MTQDRWTAVDRYFTDLLTPADPILDAALEASHVAGLPPINVAPNQGKFLSLLAQIHDAHRILEIGTLGGYSTIWLARAIPAGGRVVSLERDPRYAAVARANIARAGYADVVDVHVGPAADTLRRLVDDGSDPFDLIFIDADKPSNPTYLTWALKLSRPGTVIIVDNVVRGGNVIDPDSSDPSIKGVRHMTEMIAAEPRLSATALQTVGSKGYDGFVIARVDTDRGS